VKGEENIKAIEKAAEEGSAAKWYRENVGENSLWRENEKPSKNNDSA
jgi:hypothetical protein